MRRKKNQGEIPRSDARRLRRPHFQFSVLGCTRDCHTDHIQGDANLPDPNIRTPRHRPLLKPLGMQGRRHGFVIHLLETSSTKGIRVRLQSPTMATQFFQLPISLPALHSIYIQWLTIYIQNILKIFLLLSTIKLKCCTC